MTALRKIAQALAIPLVIVVAVIGQLAVVNRLPLPGGTAPDLVLLVVTALAVSTGPMTGLLAGFAGGLALDIAPPATHLAGEYALVFCLAGYACGRVRSAIGDASGERTMVAALTVMALGTAAGEAGKAALGRLLSDPDVTGPAIRHVLPGAIIYDLLLCPFVLWLISMMLRGPAPERAPRPEFAKFATAFRLASAGAVPGLRLAGSSPPPVPPPVRSEPKLRLASGRSSSLSGTHAAFSPAQPTLAGGRAAKVNFASPGRGNSLGPASALRTPPARPAKSPAKGWLRAERPAGAAAPRRTSPAKGWLRPDRPAAPRQRLKAPAKGWLRPARPPSAPRRKSPGRGWLRPARPARKTWYSKPPSTKWLRRDRGPWRSRGRRLLALVGGRR